ncbi:MULTISPECIES: metallophosphoesterase family protein [unclassified Nocardioides]|uniref:metallophosphoesterase family protein n=1 Tax=unclassified Nocardioides TaxID=2615069 RepID=UPI001E5134C7|nr:MULTISPECIES: metallophosphoesterase [unclassified Nocardioides]
MGLDSTWPKVVQLAQEKAPDAIGSVHAGDLIEGVRFITINATTDSTFLRPDVLPSCSGAECPSTRVAALWVEYQAAWLDHILGESPSKWNVVTFHQPVYSASAGRDEPHLRGPWVPVFQEHNIDLVQMGHDHVYARGFNNENKTDLDGVTDGPVYIVQNSGAKHYDLASSGLTLPLKGGRFTSTREIDGYPMTQAPTAARVQNARRRPPVWAYAWWAATGALLGFGVAGLLTIGIFLLPVAIALAVVGALWKPLSTHSVVALGGGLSAAPLYLAWINRSGPGAVCEALADGATSCADRWSPWPFVAVAVILLAGSCLVTVHMRRSRDLRPASPDV